MLDDARKKYWIEKDAWTSDETVFLLNGIDPDKSSVEEKLDVPVVRFGDMAVIIGRDVKSQIRANRIFSDSIYGYKETCDNLTRSIESKKIKVNFNKKETEFYVTPHEVIRWAQSHKEEYPNFPFINYEVQNVSADKTNNLTALEKIYLEVKNMYYGAGKFDPKDLETIPTSEEVINSVQEIGKKHHIKVSKRTAIAFAQMMRPEGVPSGRRPLK